MVWSFALNKPNLEAYVVREALHVVAVMLKRGWFDEDPSTTAQTVLQQLTELIPMENTKTFAQPRAVMGTKFILALLQEFSSSRVGFTSRIEYYKSLLTHIHPSTLTHTHTMTLYSRQQ